MDSRFLIALSNDYKQLYETEEGYDVIFYVGKEPNCREYHAHSFVLCNRSRYFRTALSFTWAKKHDDKFILRKEYILPNLFDIILRYLYYGYVEFEDVDGSNLLKLLMAADELGIQLLALYIQEYLISHRAKYLQQNTIKVFRLIDSLHEHEAFRELWNYCLKVVCETPKNLFHTERLHNINASLLISLLKRDDLCMDESEVFDNVLRWCFARNNVTNDPKKWKEEDIENIKGSLLQFIPEIRFYDMDATDFLYKIYFFKDILPENLIFQLMNHHIFPSWELKFDIPPSRKPAGATIVNSSHLSAFASWIEKERSSYYDKKINPYKFRLIYHSTRDGFNNLSFHTHCDNKGATIWIAQIKNSNQLIGGYNPLDWSGSGPKRTIESFIFSLITGNEAKISYVNRKGAHHAIYCHRDHGPRMGDLYCNDSDYWSYDGPFSYYPNLNLPANFIVQNYEVFQVIKKIKK